MQNQNNYIRFLDNLHSRFVDFLQLFLYNDDGW